MKNIRFSGAALVLLLFAAPTVTVLGAMTNSFWGNLTFVYGILGDVLGVIFFWFWCVERVGAGQTDDHADLAARVAKLERLSVAVADLTVKLSETDKGK